MRIVFVPASQSAEDDDKERSKERKAMMAELIAKAVRDTHARATHAHAHALRHRLRGCVASEASWLSLTLLPPARTRAAGG